MRKLVGAFGIAFMALGCGGDGATKQGPTAGSAGTSVSAGGSSASTGGDAAGGVAEGKAGAGSGGAGSSVDAECKVAEVSSGSCTCVLKQDGTLWCFGLDWCQGVSTSDQQTSLRQVVVPGGVRALAVSPTGEGEVLAANLAGELYYWGNTSPDPVKTARLNGPKMGPIAFPGAPKDVRLVAIESASRFCVVSGDNDVSCWVDYDKVWKTFKLGSDGKLVAITLSGFAVCGLSEAGSVECLAPSIQNTECATLKIDVGEKVKSLSRECLITESNAVYCKLANGAQNVCGAQPIRVPDISATAYGARTFGSCYLDPTGVVRCTGEGSAGELGNGATVDRDVYVDVDLWAGKPKSFSMGWASCAVLENDRLWCWGGELPKPGPAKTRTPVLIPLCKSDTAPTPPAPTPLEGFEDITGTPAAAVEVQNFAADCPALPVGTVVYTRGQIDLDYAVCGPTGVLERDGWITGFYGGQHYVGLFRYVDDAYPLPDGQSQAYGAVFFNTAASSQQSNCMSNDAAFSDGRTTTRLKLNDEACGASAVVTGVSPLQLRLSFTKRRYADIELKAVPGTAEIARPGAAQ